MWYVNRAVTENLGSVCGRSPTFSYLLSVPSSLMLSPNRSSDEARSWQGSILGSVGS